MKTESGFLDDKLTTTKKVMITSDYHIPYTDPSAFHIMIQYAVKYKPDYFIINGDFLDMYSLSVFDKNPTRKFNLDDELSIGSNMLAYIRSKLPNAKIVYLEGNHENRLQRFLWRNSELAGLRQLKLPALLELRAKGIRYIEAKHGYWGKDTGHYKQGDVLIMHGDARINGASYSKYSGYSAKNTMYSLQSSIVIGHTHRLSHVYANTPGGAVEGMECGCLCMKPGNVNWQNGFATMEVYGSKSYNLTPHKIISDKGKSMLFEGGRRYTSNIKELDSLF